jgi:hypothetical protein
VVEILRLALQDPATEVRRDACRRIAISGSSDETKYVAGVRKLLPDLRQIDASEIPQAAEAVIALTRGR